LKIIFHVGKIMMVC